MPTDREVWRAVKGYEGRYEVSTCGHVRNSDGIVLKGGFDKDGYVRVHLTDATGTPKKKRINQLIAWAFLGPPPPGMTIARHLDGIRDHNHISNIAWGTDQMNQADRKPHGTDPKGSRNGRAKLAESDILDIVRRIDGGESIASVARAYGMGHTTITMIRDGMSWRDAVSRARKIATAGLV